MSTAIAMMDEPAVRPFRTPRPGILRAEGQAILDDAGPFHPMTMTLFWLLYGIQHEPERILPTLDWIAARGVDGVRAIAQLDWPNRSVNPRSPAWQRTLADAIDAVHERGMRTILTLIGGANADALGEYTAMAAAEVINDGRAHKVIYVECANEWSHLKKVSAATLVKMGRYLRDHTPCLVALSAPTNPEDEESNVTIDAMKKLVDQAGANVFPLHTRRKDHDRKWAQVRQAYDANLFDIPVSLQEPPGPQSSVKTNESPLQLALMRYLGAMCGAAMYTLHAAQGVSGIEDPKYARPEWMWEVPDVEAIIKAVRGVDAWLPERIENWKVINNKRADHPLKLDPIAGFWEGSGPGVVNKNYAAASGRDFRESLLGVKAPVNGALMQVGKATKHCRVEVIDPVLQRVVHEEDLSAGEWLDLQGRVDTMAGYIIVGRYAS